MSAASIIFVDFLNQRKATILSVAPKKNPASYMLINPLLLVEIFKDIENGAGMAPDVCENMVREGWAEWIDRTTGTTVDLNHPRSMLCLTHEGQKRFAELTAL